MVDGFRVLLSRVQRKTLVQDLFKGRRLRSSLHGKQLLHQGLRESTSGNSVRIGKYIDPTRYALCSQNK